MLNTRCQNMQELTPCDNIVQMRKYNINNNENKLLPIEEQDIAAEYSAIGKMNNIIADTVKEIEKEKDPFKIKLLEARISTLNNMILKREERLKQIKLSF